MEPWKKNLISMLKRQNMENIDEKNTMLYKWLKEWTDCIREMDGICVSLITQPYPDGYKITISKNFKKPFKLSMYYLVCEETKQMALHLKYTVSFDQCKFIDDSFNPNININEEEYYNISKEKIFWYEEPITEKNFVLEYINIILEKSLINLKF